MTYPFSGERVEALAVSMAVATGHDFLKLDHDGRQTFRRMANAALYRLGGDGAGQQHGVQHISDALVAMSQALNGLMSDPIFQRIAPDLQDVLAEAGAQAYAAGKAVLEDFTAAQIETRNAAL